MIDLVDVAADKVVWHCEGCGKTDNEVSVTSLKLGVPDNPNVIVLPRCACGSQEFLQRTWDAEVDSPHRRAVNALAEVLKNAGQSHRDARAAHDRERAEDRRPALLADLTAPLEDVTGRRQAAREMEAMLARVAQWEAERPQREAAAAAARAEAEAEEEERLFQLAEKRRADTARAAVNKRLGLAPGSEPPPELLAAELEKTADAILESVADAG